MKTSKLIFLVATIFAVACETKNEDPDIDLAKKTASISVVNVSGRTNLPNQIQIDGLNNNKTSLGIGREGQMAKYEEIAAGLRNIKLGSYEDTVRLKEHNYYTLMVYDNDSLRLSLDAPYTSDNKFVTMPQVRWNMSGDAPENYKVNIFTDSLIKDVGMDKFISVSTNKKVKLSLYRKNDPNNVLGEKETDVEINKKVTVNIRYNPTTKEYSFTPIMQGL